MRSNVLLLAITSLAALTACKGDNISSNIPDDDTGTTSQTPNIVLDTRALDFGVADDVGEVLQARFTVQNNGAGDLEISAFTLSSPFQVAYTTLTVTPQSSVQITVSYSPDDYVAYDDTLVLSTNDPDEAEVELSLVGSVLVDRDGDGHDRPEAGGDDCDDTDADVYPGAIEVWYNGSDENCDGLNDYDQDGDGFMTFVEEPDPDDGGGDCNDVNAGIYPGAADTFYDGIDTDCAGNDDFDQDGDGYASLAYGRGRDCDDFSDAVYPGATERLNGQLDDCSADAADLEVTAGSADYYYTGAAQQERVGYSVAAGDIDRDGIDDAIFGVRNYSSGRGGVAVVLSTDGWPTSGSDYTAGAHFFEGAGSTDYLGSSAHILDDFDADGTPDVVVGGYGTSSSYGAIYIISADDIYLSGDIGDAHTTITGSSSNYYVGRSLATGDLNGDGSSDLLYNYSNSTNANSGYNYIGLLYGGRAAGSLSNTSVSARFTTNNQLAASYEALSDAYDINGDGYDDFVFSDQYYDYSTTNDGGTFVLWGNSSRYTTQGGSFYTSAELVVTGRGQYDRCGVIGAALPDVNDDGYGELVTWCGDDGSANFFYGSAAMRNGGVEDAQDADTILDLTSSYNPTVIRPMADWDGDGFGDWGVGIDGDGASTPGRLYILSGFTDGSVDGDEVSASIVTTADDNNTYFAHAISHKVGDFDGNGQGDLLVGDPGYDGDVTGDGTDDANNGSVWLFLNGG